MTIKKALTHLSFARAALIDLDDNTYGEDFGNNFTTTYLTVGDIFEFVGEVGARLQNEFTRLWSWLCSLSAPC